MVNFSFAKVKLLFLLTCFDINFSLLNGINDRLKRRPSNETSFKNDSSSSLTSPQLNDDTDALKKLPIRNIAGSKIS